MASKDITRKSCFSPNRIETLTWTPSGRLPPVSPVQRPYNREFSTFKYGVTPAPCRKTAWKN
jgi:hypothetical protein